MPSRRVLDQRMVKIAGRDFAPRAFEWTDSISPDTSITIEIRYRSGRYVATSFTVKARRGDGVVSADLLRGVSVAGLVKRAVSDTAMFTRWETDGILSKPDISEGPTDNNLKVVAAVYRLHLALGDNPTNMVAEKMGLTRATAGRWVMKAREKGHLGATNEGRAGA